MIRVKLTILAGVLLVLIGLPVAAVLWMTAVPGHSYEEALPPLSEAQRQRAGRLRADVVAIASEPHNVAHPDALERSARRIEQALSASGYAVHSLPFKAGGRTVRNIEAVIEPADAAAETIVVGAHYDSWLEAPGANDNGSGVAAVLELARLLADLRGKAATRIRLVLFVNEEPPFFRTAEMGSLVYARALRRTGERVRAMLSLETIGFYSDRPGSQHYPSPLDLLYPKTGNFIAFVGLTASRSLVRDTVGAFRAEARFPSVGGTAPNAMQGVGWSDHWSFEQVAIPALMVTDTAPFRYPHYHRVSDTPDKLDYAMLARVVDGLAPVLRSWATTARPREER